MRFCFLSVKDSFEDDKSKILMILCASPDPKEIHKTISTLEYGAKAKCIVRGPHTPNKDKIGTEDSSSAVIQGLLPWMNLSLSYKGRTNSERKSEMKHTKSS